MKGHRMKSRAEVNDIPRRMLYLTIWDLEHPDGVGVANKIKGQIRAFSSKGFQVDTAYVANGYACVTIDGATQKLGRTGVLRKIKAAYLFYCFFKKYNIQYRYIYSRYSLMDPCNYRLLKYLSKEGNIIVEIPTWPYDTEQQKSIPDKLLYALDKVYRNRLHRYVYRICSDADEKKIFEIKTIALINGYDFGAAEGKLTEVNCKKENDKETNINTISMIAVAQINYWHGYDRMIQGIYNYYRSVKNNRNIVFYIVGDGPPLEAYKETVRKFGLCDHIVFCGVKQGEELEELYRKSDIAVECLGLHRRSNNLWSSSLKSREYAAYGLPMITAAEMDIFPAGEYPFIRQITADETSVDMDAVINWYEGLLRIYTSKSQMRRKIFETGRDLADFSVALQPVIDEFLSAKSEDIDY